MIADVSNGPTDEQISSSLRQVSGPVFCAVQNETALTSRLTIHASTECVHGELKDEVRDALKTIGVYNPVFRFHRGRYLTAARSIEALVRKLGEGRIVYDPTGALTRARALVDAAQRIRNELPRQVGGLFYAPQLRTLYISLSKLDEPRDAQERVSQLAFIERAVSGSVKSAFGTEPCPSVRIGFGVPSTSLVPVDQSSVAGWSEILAGAIKRYWKPATIAAMLGLGSATVAQAKDPAVSESNLKLRGSFGEVIDDYSWNVEGAFTAPLSERFGFQIEAGAAGSDGNEIFGGAAHLFARDPESYLVGLFGAYSEGTDFDLDATRVGGEFEFYLDQVTLSGMAGYQFSDGLGDMAFGQIDLKWYVTNNFAISGGAIIDEERTLGRARAEWQPGFAALPGLAFHADGAFGKDDYHSVMGGLTYYFGSSATLKDRHRRQDPESALFGLFQSVQQEQERLCTLYGGPNC